MIITVSFRNKAVELAAHLHLPENFKQSEKYPALVGIHPAGGVKEQTIGLYAKQLAAHGFVAVVYDSSYQGASGGEPRLLEDPATRVEDARCAADFLSTLPYVDVERMGVFGICAGGGYALAAAQTERRFKAVAGVSPTPMGEAARSMFGQPIPNAALVETLAACARQRTAEARGGRPVYVPFVPERLEDINENTPTMLREGYDYYRTPRGQHPNSKGRFLMTSLDKMLAFSTFNLIPDLLTQPLLLIAGSKADTKIFSEQAYALSNGPKELFVVEGATHIAMYDVPEYVEPPVPISSETAAPGIICTDRGGGWSSESAQIENKPGDRGGPDPTERPPAATPVQRRGQGAHPGRGRRLYGARPAWRANAPRGHLQLSPHQLACPAQA